MKSFDDFAATVINRYNTTREQKIIAYGMAHAYFLLSTDSVELHKAKSYRDELQREIWRIKG